MVSVYRHPGQGRSHHRLGCEFSLLSELWRGRSHKVVSFWPLTIGIHFLSLYLYDLFFWVTDLYVSQFFYKLIHHFFGSFLAIFLQVLDSLGIILKLCRKAVYFDTGFEPFVPLEPNNSLSSEPNNIPRRPRPFSRWLTARLRGWDAATCFWKNGGLESLGWLPNCFNLYIQLENKKHLQNII